jgi:hypothetical protein
VQRNNLQTNDGIGSVWLQTAGTNQRKSAKVGHPFLAAVSPDGSCHKQAHVE